MVPGESVLQSLENCGGFGAQPVILDCDRRAGEAAVTELNTVGAIVNISSTHAPHAFPGAVPLTADSASISQCCN